MSRLVGGVCAGVLLLAAVGCLPDSFRLPFSGPANQHLVVAGSVGQVSTLLQNALSDAGVTVVTERHGGDLRLAGVVKENKVFCFHLRRDEGPGEVKTQVTLQWDKYVKEPDENLWRTVVQSLSAPPAAE